MSRLRASVSVIVPTLALSLALGAPAMGEVLCAKKSGALSVRTACKKKETLVDPVSLGLQGPKGDKGDAGAAGTNGSNGSALAYAHVNADGTVDEANSKNITGANVSLQLTSAYCFHDLSFTFKNAVAVIDYADTGASAPVAIAQFTFASTTAPFGDCSSQAGTQAEVATADTSTPGFAPHAFFIIFN